MAILVYPPYFRQRKSDCPIEHASCLLVRCPFAPMNSLNLKLAEEEQSPCRFERGYPHGSTKVATEQSFFVECVCYVLFFALIGQSPESQKIYTFKAGWWFWYVLIDDGFDRKSIPSHPTYWINNQFLVVLWHVLWNQMVADLDVHGIHINEHSSEVRLVVARLDFQGFTWGDFTNGGTPKWMAYKGKCIYKRMRTGVSPFLETPTCLTQDWWLFQCYSSCSFVLGYSMGDSNLG